MPQPMRVELLKAMLEQMDTYAIVLIGGMNPRIHHPSWYRLVGLFDEEEAEAALKTAHTLITPPLSQIQTPKLTIVCQDDRWEIRTSDPDQVERIQEITYRLFDDILPHTPVQAAGLNFNFVKDTNSSDVAGYLASVLVNAPLGLTTANAVAAEFVLRRSFDDHTVLTAVRPIAERKAS